MSKEAMKLALEALEGWGKGFPDNWGDLDTEAVTALREALAEQPEAQKYEDCFHPSSITVVDELAQRQALRADTWVGLTDEEKVQLWNHDTDAPLSYADAIEAKLKAKNSL